MAILKNSNLKDSRLEDDGGCSSAVSGGSLLLSSDGEEQDLRTECTSVESYTDTSEVDSGMESDEYDYSELGEAGSEYCQVGNQSCMIPYELYDLPDLKSILSVDAWNNCLTEEERLALAEYLPDMDQVTFMQTMKELLSGENLHFGCPLLKFFDMLKGGLCDPRVVLQRQGLNLLQRREHQHRLRKYQNSMVSNIVWIRDLWENLVGYRLEEKLQILALSRNQETWNYNDYYVANAEIELEDKEAGELPLRKRPKIAYQENDPSKTSSDAFPHGSHAQPGSVRLVKGKLKGMLKTTASKARPNKRHIRSPLHVHASTSRPLRFKKGKALTPFASAPDEYHSSYEYEDQEKTRNQLNDYEGDMDEQGYGWVPRHGTRLKPGKVQKFVKRVEHESPVGFSGREAPSCPELKAAYDFHAHDRKISGYFERNWSDSADGDRVDYQTRDQHSRYAKNAKGRKWEMGNAVKLKSKNRAPVQNSDLRFNADKYMPKCGSDSIRKHSQSRQMYMACRVHSSHTPIEETESDSSDDLQKIGEIAYFSKKPSFTHSMLENNQDSSGRSLCDHKKRTKLVKHARAFDDAGLSHMLGNDLHTEGKHSNKAGLTAEAHTQVNSLEDQNQTYNVIKKEKMLKNPVLEQIPCQKKSSGKKNNRLNSDFLDHSDTPSSSDQVAEAHLVDPDNIGHLKMPLSRCKSVTKKRKSREDGKALNGPNETEYLQTSTDKPTDEIGPTKKKGKRKTDSVSVTLSILNNGNVTPEKEIVEAEAEIKPARKPFPLITPTVHTGFSFSVVHLLSAVRKAMVTANVEDACEVRSHSIEESGVSAFHSLGKLVASDSEEQKSVPSLTVQEIMNRVRSNPGDPCILETQEPLQDLVRGVLKIFSSKMAPLGAKGWKALVLYEKSTKKWTWAGPVSPISADPIEEETSAEAWNIPHKMLVKLVDAFANWLKNGQETLKQIGSLPPPPTIVMPNFDEKERFRDLRAQKSLATINPSSDEVKAYFRKEEYLRYQVPDRAFSYTAVDGKKSIVAPLRRGGGKPTSKARDHFMLRPDRPPHVTILCLVRDAAARLPGSIGTRADVCALIRDSQYIMEDVSDAQVNQVVSGALDRLHYERDPCVQYDNERKLWVYLHREREEEDFEDDGTSSTKKWKKPRKDIADNSDIGVPETNCNGEVNQQAVASAVFDFSSGPNMDVPSMQPNMDMPSMQSSEKSEPFHHDLRPNVEVEPFIDSMQATVEGNQMAWEVLGLNPLQENRIVCQENSTNEDFGDDTFGREKPVGLINASYL